MTNRTVNCVKLGQEAEGLEKPPFAGELGQEIYEKVSKAAWEQWNKDMQIKVINEYRLNLGEKKDYEMLIQQMKLFLGLEAGENLEVENPDNVK